MKNYAFFDVDGTLINIKSMFSFQEYYFLKYINKFNWFNKLKYLFYKSRMKYYISTNKSREYINKKYYECFSGVKRENIRHCASKWYADLKRKNSNLFITETCKILQEHLAVGDEVVFVSGSFIDILAPIAKDLGVKHILATNMEVIGYKYTGKIIFPQTIGDGKKLTIEVFMNNQNYKSGYTFAYGDDFSDIPMLSAVDFPSVISGNYLLDKHAEENQWQKIMIA